MNKSNKYSFSTVRESSIEHWATNSFEITCEEASESILCQHIEHELLSWFDGVVTANDDVQLIETYIYKALLCISVNDIGFRHDKVWRRLDKHINTMSCFFSHYNKRTGLRDGNQNSSPEVFLACSYIWLFIYTKTREFRYLNNVLKSVDIVYQQPLILVQRKVFNKLVSLTVQHCDVYLRGN